MTRLMGTLVVVGVAVFVGGSVSLDAQSPPGQRQGRVQGAVPRGNPPAADPATPQGEPITPAYIQAMFEAMTLMEAERFMTLTPEQYPVFVQRIRRLQEARGQQMRRRIRAINELRALANPQSGRGDDATIEAKLKELDAIDKDGRAAIRKAADELDQLLSARQRARFRLLEENMERKKLDFLTKARQNGRGGSGGSF